MRGLVVGVAAVLLLGSGIASAFAPFGMWDNRLFGQPAWSESDPGAFYLASAHELAWGEAATFVGHPGTPLLPLLRGVQEACYRAAAPDGLSFSQFTARHLPGVYVVSKLVVALLHALSFWLLYRFARALVGSDVAAAFAALGYMTSLPVLYFLSRISVEPLMTLSFCGAFLALWRTKELAAAGRTGRALAFAALAAFTAVTGAVSKLNFLGPLPFLGAAWLVLGMRGGAVPVRTRALALLAFAAAGIGALVFWSQWIDWTGFFRFWRVVVGPSRGEVWRLSPMSPHGILLLCELPFVALAIAGFASCWRRSPERRSRLLWTTAYAAYALLLFGYRVYLERSFLPFHYFWIANLFVAVYFGVAAEDLLRRLSPVPRGLRAATFAVALVGAVHGVALAAVAGSRRYDAEEYARYGPLFELIAGLSTQERVAIPAFGAYASPPGLVVPSPPYRSERFRLADAFDALFTGVPQARLSADPRRIDVPGLAAEFGVVDAREAER